MRQDQRERLAALCERMAEVAMTDCDPDNWTAAGQLARDMTQQERGDAYWCRKNAATSLMLLEKLERLVTVPGGGLPDPLADNGLDAQIADAERRASALVDKALRKAGNRAEHAPGHGKKH